MKLLPAYFGARRRQDDEAPPEEPESRADVFNLIPPRANENSQANDGLALPAPQQPEAASEFLVAEPVAAEPAVAEPAVTEPPSKPIGRSRHPVGMTDLSRLSIDGDGRLYWDGKPVEVQRRLLMSRPQIVGAGLIGVFVVIAAIGATLQGSTAAHDFACKQGWIASYCLAPPPPAPRSPAVDIPA
jgi:hypothetical protein